MSDPSISDLKYWLEDSENSLLQAERAYHAARTTLNHHHNQIGLRLLKQCGKALAIGNSVQIGGAIPYEDTVFVVRRLGPQEYYVQVLRQG